MATTGSWSTSASSVSESAGSRAFFQRVSLALLAGALSGLAAGVLSRLAMRLLTLTSTDDARGLITDDQAVVGQATVNGTLALIALVTTAGAVLGPLFCSSGGGYPHRAEAASWDLPGSERQQGRSDLCTTRTPSTTASSDRAG